MANFHKLFSVELKPKIVSQWGEPQPNLVKTA